MEPFDPSRGQIVSVAVGWLVAWISASAICVLLGMLLVVVPVMGRHSKPERADSVN